MSHKEVIPDLPSPARSRAVWRLLVSCLTLLGLLTGNDGRTLCQAQAPVAGPPIAEELRLPLDKIGPELLPDRIPVPLSDYETLKQAVLNARRTPAPTRLVTADYFATYSGHRLIDGRFSWTLENPDGRPRTRSMEPLGLAIRDLQWSNGPAVWGTATAGRMELLLDRTRGTVSGLWELTGKPVGEHDEFLLDLPAAGVTHLTIRTPTGYTISAVNQPVIPTNTPDGFTEWKIVLGARTGCKVVIHHPEPEASATPLILVQNDSTYAFRQEGLRFRADFRLEVANSPLQEIPLWVDPDLEIYSITYGNDIPLPWMITSTDGRQRLLVTLPDRLLGTGRTLRVRGVAPIKTNTEWKLPRVSIAGAALINGQATLQLSPPLQLQDLTSIGYRQVGVETTAARDDILTLKQFRTDGVISLQLGKPRPRVTARVLSDLSTQSSEWTCLTQLQLTGAEGATFTVHCRVPTSWEVLDVRDTQGLKLDWSMTSTQDGQRLLILQFLEALTPDRPRIVEINARRSAANGEQTFPVPAFEPTGVDDLAMLVAINAAQDVQPVLESGTSFEPCELVELEPEWINGKFWKTPLADRTPHPLLLRLSGAIPEGQFSLQSLQTPIEVIANVNITASGDKLQKQVQLEITPRHGKTERVLVYHSEPGPQLTWNLAGSTPRPIEARKLPVVRHAAWDLPTAGELWELRLPQPQSTPFEIEGTRVRGLTATGRLGLVFVPQAQSFRGRVTVTSPLELGLELTPSRVDAETGSLMNGAQQERTWTWHRPTAALRFRTRVATQLTSNAVVRRAAITARWTLQPQAHDYYTARLELGSGFQRRELRCAFPPQAEISEVKVDGQTIQTILEPDGTLVISSLADEQIVTIDYRAESPGLLRPIWRGILLPKLDVPVLRCDVELLTPSGFRLGSEPLGMVLKSSTPSISSLQRLFGPLGRSTQEAFFNPFIPSTWSQSWAARRQPEEQPVEAVDALESSPDVEPDSSRQTPSAMRFAGWKVWRGSAAMLPEKIELWMWSNRQATGTAWLSFFTCLLIGTLLRILQVSPRGALGAIALTIEILLVFVLPPLPAQIVGACLAGTLLAVFAPHKLMRRERPSTITQQPISQGSTHTYRPETSSLIARLMLGLCLTATASMAWAQPPTGGSSSTAPPKILIPVDAQDKPLGTAPLVYIPENTFREWLALQSNRDARAGWLIQSAAYQLIRDAQNQVEFSAVFDVVVLSTDPEIELQFPLSGVNFGGADACRVNGHPHAILTRPDSPSLLVRVSGIERPSQPEPPPLPVTISESGVAESASAPIPVRRYQVEFHGYPIVQSVGDRHWMELTVPRLQSSEWTLVNNSTENSWTNAIGEKIYTVAPQQSWSIITGPVNRLRIEPVLEGAPPAIAPELEARLALLADVEPAVAQLQYQVKYRVRQGQVANVKWRLPAGIAVREVTGAEVFDWHLSPAPGGASELQIDLQSPVSEGFLIRVTALLPNDGPPTQLSIPPIQLLTPTQAPLRPGVALIGLRTSSEFRPESPSDTGEQIAPATVDEFVNEWGRNSIDTRPQSAYSLLDPAPLKVGLKPLEPQRIVRMSSIGVLGSRRLQWSLNATIEVQTAAAYTHELEIDPRLNVTNVTVQEDAANRLLRWTRTGNVLHVFLRDKTTGTQTLTLQGTMPSQVPQEVPLPVIRFQNATVADSRLQLYQEPDLEVEVIDPEKWPPQEVPSELRLGAARNLLVGRFLWDPTAGPFVVRAGRNEPVLNYSAVTSLQPRDGRWKMTTSLLFEVLQGHGSQFSIRVPPELPPPIRVDASDVLWYVEREPDQGQRILLIPQAPIRGRFVVQISGEVNLPTGGTAVIPEVLGLNASRIEHFVVLPAESALTVDPRTSGLTPEALPDELANLLPADVQGTTTGHQYRGTASSWTVSLTRHQEDAPQTGVLWSETQIWCEPTRQIAGRTSLLVGPQESEQIELTVPEGLELEGILLDGEFIPHETPANRRLAIPLTFPQAGHAVTIYWTQTTAPMGMLYQQSDFRWPRIAGTQTGDHYVTVTPPPGFRAHAPQATSVERRAVQLDEAQALLQLMQQRAAGGPAPQDPQWAFLHRQVSSLLKRLPAENRMRGIDRQFSERLSRLRTQFAPWEQLPITLNTENPNAAVETGIQGLATLEANLAGPHSLLVRINPRVSPDRLRVSMVDESISRWVIGLLSGAVMLGVMWTLLRWKVQDKLATRPAISWTLFGLIWWICLTPSWLGIIWLVIAAVYFIRVLIRRRRERREEAAEDLDLSTVTPVPN